MKVSTVIPKTDVLDAFDPWAVFDEAEVQVEVTTERGNELDVGGGQDGPAKSLGQSPVTHDLDMTPTSAVWGSPGLPDWITSFRPDQITAAVEVVEAFERGVKVVMLDAPTGSGKTLIGEMVRRLMGMQANYVCSSLTLQDQFVHDFPYTKVLKGRTNYATQTRPYPLVTAADCTAQGPDADCEWCPVKWDCEYTVARGEALAAPLAVLNTSYFLAEANGPGKTAGRGLVIVDEADLLETSLMGYVEFNVSQRFLQQIGLQAPKKGSHKKTIAAWMVESLLPGLKAALVNLPNGTGDVETLRQRERIKRLGAAAKRMVAEVEEDHWVRDDAGDGGLVLKPVRVDTHGKKYLWDHGHQWLLMSATIISPDEMADSLGLDSTDWEVVSVPMAFPVENRPIVVAPVGKMSMKEKDVAWPKMAKAVARVMEEHPNDRILVHTVSYQLSRYLSERLPRDRVVAYTNAREREGALRRFRGLPGGVLLGASLDRGVDLAGEDCRVVVVAKIPFPNLGDRQVSERLHSEGGETWYAVQTVRTLVQMTGRATRSKDDWSTVYILDSQFVGNVWKRNKGLLPGWWREAVDMSYPVKKLVG